MYHLKIEIDSLPQSLNIVLRRHYFKSNKHNKMWDTLIYGLVRNKLPSKPLERAKLKFTRHSNRFLDFDGLVGSLKPVCDSLVTAGVLIDDNWKVLQAWEVDQVFRKKKDGQLLEIEIIEL
jgi:hypothetical protein